MRKGIVTIIVILFLLNSAVIGLACTGFTTSIDNLVLVGNNEDYTLDCEPKIMTYPPTDDEFGRIVICNKPYPFGNIEYVEFGGMNDQGLFFDSFSHPYLRITNPQSKPVYNGWYIPNCLKSCSTVKEALEEFDQWVHPILEYNQILIVDRSGDSAIIEGNQIIHKEFDYQVCTNFLHSHPELGGYPCWRYNTAVNMLENMNELSYEYFTEICNATHSEGSYFYTIYSNICDLTNGIMYLYYMHDFSNIKIFNLSEEMQLGQNTYYLSDLFDTENYSPNTPFSPTGPTTGNINEEITFYTSTTDCDDDDLYYLFDWGDETDSGWLGPYESGQECHASHSWSSQGTYNIRVKAKDVHDSESDWSESLPVSMPRNKVVNRPILNFLKEHPIIYQLLQRLFHIYL